MKLTFLYLTLAIVFPVVVLTFNGIFYSFSLSPVGIMLHLALGGIAIFSTAILVLFAYFADKLLKDEKL